MRHAHQGRPSLHREYVLEKSQKAEHAVECAAVAAAESLRLELADGAQAGSAEDHSLAAGTTEAAVAGSSHMTSFAASENSSLQELEAELVPGLSSRLQPPPSGALFTRQMEAAVRPCKVAGTPCNFMSAVHQVSTSMGLQKAKTTWMVGYANQRTFLPGG